MTAQLTSRPTANPGLRQIARIAAAALLSAACVISTTVGDTLAASPDAPGKPAAGTVASKPDRHFETLEGAVTAGALDPSVVDELRDAGAVEAFVQFDDDAVRRDAEIKAPAGNGHDKAVVDGLRAGFEAMKARALPEVAGLKIKDRYDHLSSSLVRFSSAEAILRVLADRDVEAITLPRTGRLTLSQSLAQIRQPEVAATGAKGAGTYVAVLDTGVDFTRSAFGSCAAAGGTCKVAEALDFAPNDNRLDDHNHGTNVAGIVLGVAPAAKILAYDVFQIVGYDEYGDAIHEYDEAFIFQAFNRIVALKATMNIAAVNLSLGVGETYNSSECTHLDNGSVNPWTAHVSTLRGLGIAPVFAAGNDGMNLFGYREGVSYPSCTPDAIRVGAVYDADLGFMQFSGCSEFSAYDRVTCFSQNDRALLTVLAPGSSITAAGIEMHGTSQATPHVAGAFAVLKAARPSAPLSTIQSAISGSGPLVGDTRFGTTFWKHRLDLAAAMAAVPAADTTKPVVTKPGQSIVAGTTLGTNGAMSVLTSWSATDASGIAAYAVQLSVNGTWYDYTANLASPTAKSLQFNGMTPGVTYTLAVAARDGAGNWSAWKYGDPFTVSTIAENGAGVAYSTTGWTRTAWASAHGGYIKVSATANTWATYTVTGAKSLAWVATTATNRGSAKVYLDGVLVKTISLNGATVARRVQYAASVDPTRQHVLKIVVVGTAGTPSVDVDAFIVIK